MSGIDLPGSGSGSGETTTTFGALVNSAWAATPNDTDLIATAESGWLLKKLSWTNAKAFLKTYFDTQYFTTVTDADIVTSDITTNNASTGKHGFLSKLPWNSLQFLDWSGNFSTPAAGVANSYSLTTFTGQTSVTVTHNFGTYPNVQILDGTSVAIPLSIVNNTLNDFTVTFSVATSGSIIATVGSPQPQALISVSNDYTVLVTDRIVQCTAASKTITLPTAVGNSGREFKIKNSSNGNITVEWNWSELIDNQLNQTVPSFSSVTVYSNGTSYFII